ncbi:chromate transporter [Trichlorobacter lovleyi]|uniref:Chromate transporter n=1 Tax=Trichlorobacter lovleyi (strain ATCC BAA-1151 / DSM 17278 / SZ) TaxID=398767 RepID=B3E282_TRIL1|nr:chromate transporter [Trichlorobacter lovleyi]ACD97185.1 Chromate transporter [Trichlorobacter lovleyi SZ]
MLTLAWTYLRIGLIFFGGGYVLIPLLQHLLVEQYKWLTLREFLDGVAISQLTPGPLAMLATFTGVRVAGFGGGLVATICIFAPCIVLMLFVGRYYARLKEIDLIRSTLDGVLPAVVGLVASAAWSLGTTLGSLREWLTLLVAFCIFRWTRINPMVMILGAGIIGMLF